MTIIWRRAVGKSTSCHWNTSIRWWIRRDANRCRNWMCLVVGHQQTRSATIDDLWTSSPLITVRNLVCRAVRLFSLLSINVMMTRSLLWCIILSSMALRVSSSTTGATTFSRMSWIGCLPSKLPTTKSKLMAFWIVRIVGSNWASSLRRALDAKRV